VPNDFNFSPYKALWALFLREHKTHRLVKVHLVLEGGCNCTKESMSIPFNVNYVIALRRRLLLSK